MAVFWELDFHLEVFCPYTGLMKHFSHMVLVAVLFWVSISANLQGQPMPSISLRPVFPKLTEGRPVWMIEAPDGSGRFFVVYQKGLILIVNRGSDGSDARVFLNIEDRHPNFSNEDGLLSLAFHPGFATNHLFYIYYNQENNKAHASQPLNFPYRSVVSEMKVSDSNPDQADLGTERILLQVPQPFPNHKGGELLFGPDGYLYLGLGDGGAGGDPFGSGQNTCTLLAKLLRLDVNSRATEGSGFREKRLEYGIPQDNPFANEPDRGGLGVRREIYAYGLRNPWRYSFDRKTGDLWVGDVGQDLWEEIDLITKGGNYGWSVREGAHYFKPGPVGAQYIEPVMEYPHNPALLPQSMFPDHSIGLCVIGGYVYRGGDFPALDGIYIYGDYNLGTIWGFRFNRSSGRVTDQGQLLAQSDNIDSFAEDARGELYALMQDGKIEQITSP